MLGWGAAGTVHVRDISEEKPDIVGRDYICTQPLYLNEHKIHDAYWYEPQTSTALSLHASQTSSAVSVGEIPPGTPLRFERYVSIGSATAGYSKRFTVRLLAGEHEGEVYQTEWASLHSESFRRLDDTEQIVAE